MVQIRPFRSGDELALHAVFYSAVHQLAAAHYTAAQLAAWAPADHDTAQWAERMRRIQPFVAEIGGSRSAMPICSRPAISTTFSSAAPMRGKGWARP